jgi:hypothetical protein
MTTYDRFQPLPIHFRRDYEHVLVVMQLLASDIRMGRPFDGNCHVVARAMAKFYPNFRVADGFITSVSPKDTDETHGAKCALLIENEAPMAARYKQLNHSWLVWKNSNIVLDIWPIGAAFGMGLPTTHLQDGWDMHYVEAALPELADAAMLDERVKACISTLGKIFDSLPI